MNLKEDENEGIQNPVNLFEIALAVFVSKQ